MRFSEKIQSFLYAIYLILFSGFPIALALINMMLYGGVLNTKLQFLSIMMIIPVVVIRKMHSYSFRSAGILLAVALFIYVNQYLGLPSYTYSEGRELLRDGLNESYGTVTIVHTRRDSYIEDEIVNRYIDEVFYYEIESVDQVIAFIMNPVTGAYKILEEN